MRRLITILSLLVCFYSPTFSQNFAPVGAKWHYSVDDYQPPFNKNYILIESIKDTVVLGKNAKKLDQTIFYGAGGSGYIGFDIVYSDSNKVYIYRYNDFKLLYDFNANQGDTVYVIEPHIIVCGGNNDTLIQVLIDSVKIENIGGTLKKVQYVTNLELGWVIGDKYVETVGSNHYLIPIDCVSPSQTDSLRCYSDSTINYQLVVDCEELAVGIEEIYENELTINTLIKNNIMFNDIKGTFIVYDINGRIMLNQKIKPSINIDFLKPGIYILVINTQNSYKRYKILKL
jgi:hypothetical protein